jgi:RNA polymerase sigma-70 factor (ECF subfamily)
MYKNQIYTLCIRLTQSPTHAEDLFGETWVKVAEKINNIKKEKNPMNWIYTVCLNLYRKSAPKWRKEDVSDDFFDDETILFEKELNTEENIIKKETLQQMYKAVSALSDTYRIPIILFYFRDLSYKEISEMMKLPIGTVKFRLNYAKKLLQKEMEVLL